MRDSWRSLCGEVLVALEHASLAPSRGGWEWEEEGKWKGDEQDERDDRDDTQAGRNTPHARLQKHLARHGLALRDVPGDNNCQFHAVADQLGVLGFEGWDARALRREIVAWLAANGDRPMDDGTVGERTTLREAVGADDWPGYLAGMARHGRAWGDEATLLAASALFRVRIVVISSISKEYCHVVTPPKHWRMRLCNGVVHLGHHHEYHYVSTRPLQERARRRRSPRARATPPRRRG